MTEASAEIDGGAALATPGHAEAHSGAASGLDGRGCRLVPELDLTTQRTLI